MAFLQFLVFIPLSGSSLRLDSVIIVVVIGRRIIVGNETDRLAMLEFKKRIDDPYRALSSWNDSVHFCNWVGITCGNRHQQRVISLDLGEKGLGGNISPSIGNLRFLHFLNIGNNSFQGQIPQEIGNLIRLREINFNNNTFEGEIPTSLANCTLLRDIHFSRNNLVGNIPVELFMSLSMLEHISINYNGLTGELLASFESLDLYTNRFQGLLPNFKANLSTQLLYLRLGDNQISGTIPAGIENLINLTLFSIKVNFLEERTIPQSLTLLKGLQDLDISCNNLSSQIPKDLENLLALQSLSLSFNNLEGEVPTKGVFGNASAIFLNGNEKLCGGVAKLQLPTCTNHGSTKREKSHAFKIVLALMISLVLGFILIASFLTRYWIRKSISKPPSTPLIGDRLLKICYYELFQATGGFSSVNLIGSGSFGFVYKGIINQDVIVAVKVLNLQNPRAYKSFTTECEALRNIRHRNLVKILTSCSSLDSKGKDFKALVYEFMPNGSLDDWLHLPMEAHNQSRNFSFLQRLNIAIDVAFAIEYLHYHCYAPIVHCDLKPSNVLLDSYMTAHVSDFGLARLLLELDDDSSQTQTSNIRIKGSIGYAAPDSTLQPKEKPGAEIEEEATNRTEGPSHRTDKLQDCVTSIIEIALCCSMDSPKERMDVNDVVEDNLQGWKLGLFDKDCKGLQEAKSLTIEEQLVEFHTKETMANGLIEDNYI
ncbi:LRR receptor-like serine/threonine-protein kinase EFR [Macadamia integrifolia]|uniref:LRR receptor-like serine/threonine-protein kinase EFR n=1 Tax=Macadamia integrifolia TaxID=60698 RepID=UPI001C52E7DC|nr:LRR receptor-like serine/threonine-protein kinase EFR [Macadamia integrifolia]